MSWPDKVYDGAVGEAGKSLKIGAVWKVTSSKKNRGELSNEDEHL